MAALVDVKEVIHNFATLVEGQPMNEAGVISTRTSDLLLICRKARGYAEHHFGQAISSKWTASECLRKFGDLAGKKAARERSFVTDPNAIKLRTLLQAMRIWAEAHARFNLLENRPLGVIIKDGKAVVG